MALSRELKVGVQGGVEEGRGGIRDPSSSQAGYLIPISFSPSLP